jgi:nitrite reductase/ring-hydroxylating ferredoxin subunit
VRRMGVAHAAANSFSLLLYSGSYAARRRDRRGLGMALGLAGGGALAIGGYLGGHLSYARGVGVDQTAFEEGPEEWTPSVPESALQDGTAVHAVADGIDLLLVKQGGRVFALSDRCSHRGGPLHEGTLADGCVTCPLHGSSFRLEDGSVERGPATAPQPAWETRVVGGRVEVRAPRLTQVI